MVGLFLLEKLNDIIPKEGMVIYRDDELSVIPDNGPNTARTDFLDVIMDLNTEKTKPFRKENDNSIYINTESNHPPSVIKQLTTIIATTLSGLSSRQKEFNDSKPIYEKALEEAGYSDKLKYPGKVFPTRKSIKKDLQQKHCQNVIQYNKKCHQIHICT